MAGAPSSRIYNTAEVFDILDDDGYMDEPICDGSDDDLGDLGIHDRGQQ